MEENLQLEEIQRTNQQTGNEIPHDPNAATKYPEGYTPIPDVNEQTPVEEVEPSSVGEVEETTNVVTPQTGDLKNEGSLSSSGDFVIASDSGDTETKTLNSISPTLSNDVSLDFVPSSDATVVSNSSDATNSSVQEETVDSAPEDLQDLVNPQDPQDPQEPESPVPVDPEDPEEPPTEPPVDPEDPEEPPTEPPVDPEDPEEPPTEPPVDPEEPPTEPPVDPEDPEEPPTEPPTDPEEPPVDPEDPEEPPTEPPTDPEEPPVDPEDPEEPPTEPPVDPEDPEEPSGGNPGNDKEVGNSPWDGETGASDNPGKGNHQDGEDPETNQPPGDSKNDGGQGNNSENDNGNGGGGGNDFERGQNNGWGNGDDTPPGNSGSHNNAENDETPNSNTSTLVEKFLENHSFNDEYDNRGGRPEIEYDTYEPEDIGDVNIPDVPEPIIEFEVHDYATDSFDFTDQ
jgi:hypothetical protein